MSAANHGNSRMLTIVSRKPTEVCSVRAVPTWVRTLYSVTSAENCAESATTENPQTDANRKSRSVGAPKKNPAAAEQAALVRSASRAIRAFPSASAQRPAATQPTAPLAIAANAISEPVRLSVPCRASRAAPANAEIQVHIA